MRQFADFFRIAVVFYYLINFFLRVLYIYVLIEYYVKTAVTRLVVGIGKYQIVKFRYVYKGGRVGIQRRIKTRYFSQFTGDQRRTRIRIKIDIVGYFRINGNNVFYRVVKLYVNEIRIVVNAEIFVVVQQLLEIIGKGLIGRGQRNSCR